MKSQSEIEEFQPGHRRQFVSTRPGCVQLRIQHRLTQEGVVPELWSGWEAWKDEPTEEAARAWHDQRLRTDKE